MKELKQDNLEIELIDTEEKNIEEITSLLASYGMKNIENPFMNISVKDVAKDLNIGKNKAYELFKQDDFPSLNIGRSWKIMLLSYLLWKLHKRI